MKSRLSSSAVLAAFAAAILWSPCVLAAEPTVTDCLAATEASLKSGNEHHLRTERNQLLVCAAATCPADIRKECMRRIEDVNAAMPTILFEAKDAAGNDLSAVKVTMDGERIAERLEGMPISIDPGSHVFVFETPGQPPVTKKFVIRESQKDRREAVVFAGPRAGVSAGASAGASQSAASQAPFAAVPPDEAKDGLGTQKVMSLVAGGLGVAGLAVGAAFGLATISKKSQAQEACPNLCSTQSGVDAWSDAKAEGNVSTALVVVGGIALAGAVVLVYGADGPRRRDGAGRHRAAGASGGGNVVTRLRVRSLLAVASFFSVIEGCDALLAIDDHGLAPSTADAAAEGGAAPADGDGAREAASMPDASAAGAAKADAQPDGEVESRDATLPSNDAEASVGNEAGRDSSASADGDATRDSGGPSCPTNNGGCNPALPCVQTGPGTVACLTVTELASGDAFNCARLSDGTIRCWGLNQIYELGATSPAQSPTPLTIGNSAGTPLSNVVDVAAGAFFGCARDTQGVVQCWGDNSSGTLGDRNETSTPAPVTVQIPGPATHVGSGHIHNCASLASGAVECWGGNPQGQLGDGTTTNNLTPVTAIASGATAVAAGDYDTCAIVSGGFVQCWGSNMYGQIGDGTTIDRPTPTTALVAGATAVAVGSGHTCAIVTGGAVQCWGRNDVGQLGDGTLTERSTPITAIAANAVSLAVSSFDYNPAHTCAVLSSGSVQCWGSNEFGQLGDGTMTDEYAPETVIESGAAAVTCGTRHTCVLMLDGTVRCWGDDQFGATAGSSPTTPVSIQQ